jgi:hypothetical protein
VIIFRHSPNFFWLQYFEVEMAGPSHPRINTLSRSIGGL